ncbi:MAG: uroporphyrinogen decarboxylase family protein, partial [Candidatus Humimicrobiaceae bacterium]
GHSGMNDNIAVEIETLDENSWKIKDEYGFWSVVKYVPSSDTSVIIDHCLRHNGLNELKRLIKVWKNKDYSKLPQEWQIAVNAMKVLKKQEAFKNHYIMGYADILPPFLEPWAGLFLELVITEPTLVFDYMELQAEGWFNVLKAELETGVLDGVFGSMDFCFNSGCLISPKHFKKLFAPGLKKIVDLVYSHNMKYIKHCDGNVLDILDIMIDYCGIDAIQPIEPTGDEKMTLGWLKKQYGKKITLCGNVDCGKMVNWTPGEIENEVKKAIKTAAPGGGYIISTSNSLHGGIPPENAIAYVKSAHEWGKYPINI